MARTRTSNVTATRTFEFGDTWDAEVFESIDAEFRAARIFGDQDTSAMLWEASALASN